MKQTAYSTQHTAYSTQHTAYSTQHIAHRTQHIEHSTQHIAYSTQKTAHSTQHTAHSRIENGSFIYVRTSHKDRLPRDQECSPLLVDTSSTVRTTTVCQDYCTCRNSLYLKYNFPLDALFQIVVSSRLRTQSPKRKFPNNS